jgi:1-acyl-sn-glycerol-3-phosphate acyltransferase
MRSWLRRLLVIPLYFGAALLAVLLAPAWILIFGLVDVLGARRLTTLRCVAYFAAYLWIECIGITATIALWLYQQVRRAPRQAYLARLYRLQAWWGRRMLGAGAWLFRLRFEHTGGEALDARGPMLVFIRHASTADTMLPLVLFGGPRLHLRFVLKKELLFDPCLDLVGNQLPNYFIDRAVGGPEEIAGIARLAEHMGPDDGVLLYPEGTRFTPRKRQRIIDRLREKGDLEAARRAEALQCVLPPRLGGALALLDACDADVVVLAHSGFDGITSLRDLIDGSFVGRTIRTRLTRFPRAHIPADPAERAAWLHRRWLEVDAWVMAQHERAQPVGLTSLIG